MELHVAWIATIPWKHHHSHANSHVTSPSRDRSPVTMVTQSLVPPSVPITIRSTAVVTMIPCPHQVLAALQDRRDIASAPGRVRRLCAALCLQLNFDQFLLFIMTCKCYYQAISDVNLALVRLISTSTNNKISTSNLSYELVLTIYLV